MHNYIYPSYPVIDSLCRSLIKQFWNGLLKFPITVRFRPFCFNRNYKIVIIVESTQVYIVSWVCIWNFTIENIEIVKVPCRRCICVWTHVSTISKIPFRQLSCKVISITKFSLHSFNFRILFLFSLCLTVFVKNGRVFLQIIKSLKTFLLGRK